jgi:hypothetical protein
VRGQELTIEFRDSYERVTIAVHPGMVDWDQPDARVHREVNTGPLPTALGAPYRLVETPFTG